MLLDKRIQLVYIAVDDYVQPFLHRVVLGNLLDGKRFRHFFFLVSFVCEGVNGGGKAPCAYPAIGRGVVGRKAAFGGSE